MALKAVAMPEIVIGPPVSRSLSLGTAYQASDPTQPARVSININSTANITLTVGTTNTADVVIGPTAAVAAGTGTVIAQHRNSMTGVLTLGLGVNSDSSTPASFLLPAGWYFAVRQTGGTVSIVSAFDQVLQP